MSFRWQYLQFVEPLVDSQPTDTRLWRPIHPDRVYRWTIHPAYQQAFTTGSTASSLPVPDRSWQGWYPDRVDRPAFRVDQQQAFTTGTIYSILPVPDLSWQAQYPDRVDRPTLPVAALPFFSFWPEPIPNQAAPDLSWHPTYPDRIPRAILPSSAIPSFFLGPLVPIPNPPVEEVLNEPIHFGTEESAVIGSRAAIGGWVPFGG